ncbi:VOC family protein [Aestuariispira insulae]|uniref:VOC domain-containing protein n=1 Tax=Aestuariispira insulae TaxID=1461337 RepID=A0A3D9HGL5_9PROT|nr:VOC family protein [Aestuariispira insulae]RED48613.1 hypothetical protein DFP90_107117 [Aestuariispira insulae]
MEQRLSLVSLGVNDLGRSRAFYEKMGWQASPKNSNDNIVFFQLGGIVLGLYSRAALAEEARLTDDGGFGGITLAHNGRSKEEVDQVLEEAVAAGATLLKPAEEVFWGGYSGYFADPDGHPWEVAYNPFLPIAEDGSVTLPEDE